MEKEIVDKIFQKELKKWHLQDRGWTWRYGYPKSVRSCYWGNYIKSYSESYTEYWPEINIKDISINKGHKTKIGVKIDVRHELYHAFCHENCLEHSDFMASMSEFFPLEKILIRRLTRETKKEN